MRAQCKREEAALGMSGSAVEQVERSDRRACSAFTLAAAFSPVTPAAALAWGGSLLCRLPHRPRGHASGALGLPGAGLMHAWLLTRCAPDNHAFL